MKLFGAALALVLLAPTAFGATAPPEFPDGLRALYSGWLDEHEALVTPEDREKAWFPEAEKFLERARKAESAGRVREGMYHLETFRELFVTNRLMEEAASMSNDAERRLYALQRLRATHSEVEVAWNAYREKLHGYDDKMRSLHTVELAIYSGDVALNGMLGSLTFEPLAQELAKQHDFPQPYIMGLVRASSTSLMAIGWANDILDLATRTEGLPPKIVEEGWANISQIALKSGLEKPPAHLDALEGLARSSRANNESTLSIAFFLQTQRLARISSMETIFGDATSRGKDVLNDAARFMAAQANNTTLATPRSYGAQGVFTSDALDRIALTQTYLEMDKVTLDIVLASWASIDHATYATGVLARMSPVSPPAATTAQTPALGLVALVGVVALVGLLARRR